MLKRLILSIYFGKFIILFFFIILFIRDFLNIVFKREIHIGYPSKYFENNLDFSKYSSTIKPIAIYDIDFDLRNDNLNNNDYELLYENNKIIFNKLQEYINFASSHGIYGFAFYYSFSQDKIISLSILNMILQNKKLKINFLIIFEKKPKKNDIYKLFDETIKYIEDKRYIKFFGKYVIGINNDAFNNKDVLILRKVCKEHKLGEIFVISLTDNYINIKEYVGINNGFCYSPTYYSLEKIKFHYNRTNYYFYTHLIYYNLFNHPLNNTNIFRMSIPLTKYPINIPHKKSLVYLDYSPEKFYFLNKIIMDWTKINYSKENQYIFIDNFNNLKKDDVLGYANINSFSKALFNLPFILDIDKSFNLLKLENKVLILIQVHIYYTDLLTEIINKTNNVPFPFDLYITTNSQEKKNYIENNLKNVSKANKFLVLITPNKGRDVIPCLIQLKDIIMKYKYLCHIHTKKNGKTAEIGRYWQHYLYENLLGNKLIIQQILSDFENHSDLGFIFPEHFYSFIKAAYNYSYQNWYYLNKIFDILFPNLNLRTGNIMNFPVGNMFWAKTHAIHQIFDERIIKLAPEENGQKDGTIQHAIERFWLYLVKLNGFNYKTILYYI